MSLPVETVDWNSLLPTYPYRFKGPAYFYCVWCEHFIRLVCRTQSGVQCSECGQALALAAQ